MRLCDKHEIIIKRENPYVDVNKIFSEFLFQHVNPDEQNLIDRRKHQCPICFQGKVGTTKLKEIIKTKKIIAA